MRRFEHLRDVAVAAGPGTDTPEWKAVEEFLEYCQKEVPHGAHTPAYLDWMNYFNAYRELSAQVQAQGAKADPESVRVVREWTAFYAECFREWKEAGELDVDLIPYNERDSYIAKQKQRVEATQGVK
jgi:hypothetical protein